MLKRFQALGRLPKTNGAGRMNKTEAEYARMLDAAQKAGEIQFWRFEAVKVRLADATFYTPDFLVLNAAGELELHEVKGVFVMDDARVKFKVCAEHFPARLVWAQKLKGGAWSVETVNV